MVDNVSATQTLASFVKRIGYDDLPPEVIHATKRLILDTVGCAIGGYSSDIGKIVMEVKRELGGTPESTLLVVGERTSCTSAAYVNTELSNALDAEETFMNSSHQSGCVVMPALAVGEKLGASGKQVIEAVALGFDVTSRIGLSLRFLEITPDGATRFAPVSGMSSLVFGSAVAAGKLLRLSEEEMVHTLGLAGCTAPVPVAGKWVLELKKSPRPMTKYGFFGPIAESGVTAALLAQNGFQGDTSVLDGERGFWRMVGSLACDWDMMLTRLGEQWWVTETSYKPYPCCSYIHAPLDLFLKILREHSLTPSQVGKVKVKVPSLVVTSNLDAVLVPQNDVDIQFSIPYCLAIAAYHSKPGPGWQSADKRHDPRIVGLAKKVSVEVDPHATQAINDQLAKEGRYRSAPFSVEVETNNGQTYRFQTEFRKGDPWSSETAMTDDELTEKFRSFSYGFLRNSKIENAIQAIWNMDRLDRIDDVMHYLC